MKARFKLIPKVNTYIQLALISGCFSITLSRPRISNCKCLLLMAIFSEIQRVRTWNQAWIHVLSRISERYAFNIIILHMGHMSSCLTQIIVGYIFFFSWWSKNHSLSFYFLFSTFSSRLLEMGFSCPQIISRDKKMGEAKPKPYT